MRKANGYRGGGVRGEEGVALFVAMMFLVLLGGFALLMLKNAGTERMIGGYVTREVTSVALAEAGVEQVISWFAGPGYAPEPHRTFFEAVCPKGGAKYILEEKLTGISVTATTTVSPSSQQDGRCTVSVRTGVGKGVQVDLARNPMPKITAPVLQGIQDSVIEEDKNPPHLEINNVNINIRNDSDAGLPVSDDKIGYFKGVPLDKMESFIRRFGRYFEGQKDCLVEQKGASSECKSFDALFAVGGKNDMDSEEEGSNLVLIDTQNATEPFSIPSGAYKGYFYFTGDITIEGKGTGRQDKVYFRSESTGMTYSHYVQGINLSGLLYTPKKIIFKDPLAVHGAVYAGEGFVWEGDCQDNSPCLNIWYNNQFSEAHYQGVVPLIRVPGTWRTM